MRTSLAILATIALLPSLNFAQPAPPDSISFQGRLTNTSGDPINTSITITTKLYKGATDVHTQTHSNVDVVDGVFNLAIGPTDTVAFDQPMTVGVKVGTDAEMVPRAPLRIVPYAHSLRHLRVYPKSTGFASPNLIGGLLANSDSAGAEGVTISGGGHPSSPNRVVKDFGTISGGRGNRVSESYGTVGGGTGNVAGGTSSTVAGGTGNMATGTKSTVSGGENNQATGTQSTVGGGTTNGATETNTTVAGGSGNSASGNTATVGGGSSNTASGGGATVAGGTGNTASGWKSAVGGGDSNEASGSYSFAVGRAAAALHSGSFVFADSTCCTFATQHPNQFIARALGGAGFGVDGVKNADGRFLITYDKSAADVAQIRNLNSDPGSDVLVLEVGVLGDPDSTTDFIQFWDGDSNKLGQIEGDGSGGVTYKSGAADFAEFYPLQDITEDFRAGDIVGLVNGKVTRRTSGADRISVVSRSPVVLGNARPEVESVATPIALLGQVDVNIVGSAKPGDLILASGKDDGLGYAIRPEDLTKELADRFVGRVLSQSNGDSAETVRVEVGVANDTALWTIISNELEDRESRIRSLERLLREQEARLQRLESALQL